VGGPESVIAAHVEPPFPSQRIVWHVNLSAQGDISHLVVNVFDGASPYAFEQGSVMSNAPTTAVTSTVASMSKHLLADIAARENMPKSLRDSNETSCDPRKSDHDRLLCIPQPLPRWQSSWPFLHFAAASTTHESAADDVERWFRGA
jgi:hypothetical protein